MENEQFHVVGLIHDASNASRYLHLTLGSIAVYSKATGEYLTTANLIPNKFDEKTGLPSNNIPRECIEVVLGKPEPSVSYTPLWINFVHTPSSLKGKEHELKRTGLVVTGHKALIALEDLMPELEKEFANLGLTKIKPGDNYLDDCVYQLQITSISEQVKRGS